LQRSRSEAKDILDLRLFRRLLCLFLSLIFVVKQHPAIPSTDANGVIQPYPVLLFSICKPTLE
jgi:hypothetical protein